ncbi:MAG: helix-turn-helix domain-containing protein [Oscillospiraceae bacterium]|jgi:methylphosphotriester-DNA--protein-cysteine methyltransferase|nr:helix-turn-helix domain-containing protein [Oscillospiraceae bacterium]
MTKNAVSVQPLFLVNTTKYFKKIVPDTPYVHFYSFTADADGSEESSALPDGCADMLFTFSGNRAEGRLCGFVTKRDLLALPRGETCFGVRFKPGYLPERLDVSLTEIVNKRPDIADMPGGAELTEKLAEADGFEARAELLRSFIGGRWRIHGLLRQLIAEIELRGGAVRVSELEEKTLYSARYINRVFDDNLGLSPKAFARCVRFQKVIGVMNSARRPGLAELSADAGYYDQPHFTKEFREMTGMTPREYLAAVDVERYNDKFVYV